MQAPPTFDRHTREGGYPVRRGFSVQSRMPLEYWADSPGQAGRRQLMMWRALPSRAQRVGILDHIGAAAGGGAGREQHKTLGGKYLAWKIAAHRQIIRDILAGSIVQPRQQIGRAHV